MVAVAFFYDGFGIWFAVFINRVVPGHIQQWPVPWVSRVFEAFAQAFAKFVEELQLRARVTGRGHCLVTPLNQTLCLGERAGLFRVVGRGHEEDFSINLFSLQLTGWNLWTIAPPGGGLNVLEVAHDHPLQIGHPYALHAAIR